MSETSSEAASRPVVALADMLFASRIRGVADALGRRLVMAGTPEAMLAAVRKHEPGLVLIDLELRSGAGADAIRQLREAGLPGSVTIVGFASHMNGAAIAAGRAAGADRVLARSAFVAELPALLARETERAP